MARKETGGAESGGDEVAAPKSRGRLVDVPWKINEYLNNRKSYVFFVKSRDMETEAVEAVTFLRKHLDERSWKRK